MGSFSLDVLSCATHHSALVLWLIVVNHLFWWSFSEIKLLMIFFKKNQTEWRSSRLIIKKRKHGKDVPPPGAGSGRWSALQPDLSPPLLLFPSSLACLLMREAQPLVKGLRALQEAPTQHMRVTSVTHRSQQSLLGHVQAWHVAVTRWWHRAHPAL